MLQDNIKGKWNWRNGMWQCGLAEMCSGYRPVVVLSKTMLNLLLP